MRCYLCDTVINTPEKITAIVACPGCKRDIITDGTGTEEVETLRKKISELESNPLIDPIVMDGFSSLTLSYEKLSKINGELSAEKIDLKKEILELIRDKKDLIEKTKLYETTISGMYKALTGNQL